jgi:hypothetical protein
LSTRHTGLCLFKEARRETGEDWAEKVAAELATFLGLPHAVYELAICGRDKGVITPRITTFDQKLVHGNELLVELHPDYAERNARYRAPEHTVSTVVHALDEPEFGIGLPDGGDLPPEVTGPSGLFAGYLLLDALIGNTDRHHENWAIIELQRPDIEERYVLAPTFDHASSLGRNEPLDRIRERLATRDENFTAEAYARRARSGLHSSADPSVPLAPLDAFGEIHRYVPEAVDAWRERLERVSDEALDKLLHQVPVERMHELQKEFVRRFIRYNRTELTNMHLP